MARSTKKSRTLIVKLFSSALTGTFFVASRPRTAPKLAMMRHDSKKPHHLLSLHRIPHVYTPTPPTTY
ncbi:hypothetical protein BDY24DRAFT_410937 [Mrakia frigida]|uniref:uncharacterized protein n=1 Tax=Mrakia frigida TaxID=29902 RepID=UPI003FCC128A